MNDLPDVVEVTELPPLGSAAAPADEVIAVVDQYSEANGDVYAGKVLAGGRLWVGVTRDADGHLAELRSRLPAAGPPVGAFRAPYSLRELRALQDEVTAAMSALRAEGVDVSVVGASEYDNRLHIGVRGGDAEHASRVLARRYPLERIVIETGVEVRPVPLER